MSEEEVRRLLARARHTTPVPDDVAARVDAALSQAAPPGPASPVVDLDARRRRRRVTGALAAAAVVVVAGVGLGASGALDGSLDGSGGSAESSAGSGSPDSSDRSGGGTDGGDEAPGALDAPRDPGTSDGGGRSRFDAESGEGSGEGSGAARGGGRPVVRDGSTLVADLVDAARSARPDLRVVAPCAPRAVEGERVRVRFEPGPRGAEVPAEVVLVAAEDGARRAEVWSCAPGAGDAGGPLRSALLPPR